MCGKAYGKMAERLGLFYEDQLFQFLINHHHTDVLSNLQVVMHHRTLTLGRSRVATPIVPKLPIHYLVARPNVSAMLQISQNHKDLRPGIESCVYCLPLQGCCDDV